MSSPLFSVILPTYNRSSTIQSSVNSVLKQTLDNFELIVVDDHSEDNTEERIRSIQDQRIIYYKLKENRGANFARNYGIEKAKGKYIAFQDSDDIWRENYLEIQFEKFEKVEDKFAGQACRYNLRMDNLKKIVPTIHQIKNGITLERLFLGNLVGTPVLIVKKKALQEVKGFDTELPALQDWDLAIRLLKESHHINSIDDVLVDVFVSKDSITRNPQKKIKALGKIVEKNKDFLDTNRKCRYNLSYASYSIVRQIYPKNRYTYLKTCFHLAPFSVLNLKLIAHEILLLCKRIMN